MGSFTSNPLNSVEKNELSERRNILDLSFPKGNSIDEWISQNRHMGEHIKNWVNLVRIVFCSKDN